MEDLETKTLSEKKSVDSDTTKRGVKLTDIFSFSALVLTLTTGLLYFLGTTYYSGYLSYWGLPEELFSLSRENSIISGVVAYALICARELLNPLVNLIYFAEALAIIAILCTVRCFKDFLIRYLRKFFHLTEPYVTRHLDMSDDHKRTINQFGIGMLIVALPLILTFAIAKTALWADNQGKEVAKSEYNRILTGSTERKPFDTRAVLYLKNASQGFDPYSGHLIRTSSTHCALYSKATGVSIFPLANVSRIVIHENKTGAKQ